MNEVTVIEPTTAAGETYPRTPFGEWIVIAQMTPPEVARRVREAGGPKDFSDKSVRAAIRGRVGRAVAEALARFSGLPVSWLLLGAEDPDTVRLPSDPATRERVLQLLAR